MFFTPFVASKIFPGMVYLLCYYFTIGSVSFIRVFILKEKKEIPEPTYSKNAPSVFLWLDDLVLSAWLQSQRPFWLASRHKSARTPTMLPILLVERNYFSEGNYCDWTKFFWSAQLQSRLFFFLLKSAYQQPSRSTVKAKALLRQWTRKTAHFIQHKTTVPILRFHIFISFLIPFRFSDQNNLKHLFEFITFIFHYTKVTLNIKKKKLNWDLKCLCERML